MADNILKFGNVTINETLAAFLKITNVDVYKKACTAILYDPSIISFSGAKSVKVREVTPGKLGNYAGKYGDAVGTPTVFSYGTYTLANERYACIQTDASEELEQGIYGTESMIAVATRTLVDKSLAEEQDASNIATLSNRIPEDNTFTVTDMPIDSDHILSTVNRLLIKLRASEIPDDAQVAVFINTEVEGALRDAMIKNSFLANPTALREETVPMNIRSELFGNEQININVIRYGQLYFITVPDARMNTKITMLDGRSEGQKAGGFTVDADSKKVQMLAIPLGMAWYTVKFSSAALFVPTGFYNSAIDSINAINNKLVGNTNINFINSGFNQKADGYESNLRIQYGADIFNNYRKNCFLVTAA